MFADSVARFSNVATPVECALAPAVHIPGTADYFADWGLGNAPIWAVAQGTPPSSGMSTPSPSPGTATPFALAGPSPNGWRRKVLWVIEPGWTTAIDLSGVSDNGDQIEFGFGDQPITAHPVLDPAIPGIPIQHGNWAEFPSFVYFQVSGCYAITANWQGGSWTARLPVEVPDQG